MINQSRGVLQAFLKKSESDGSNLYQNIKTILQKIPNSKCQDLNDFQKLINFIKKNNFKVSKFLSQQEIKSSRAKYGQCKDIAQYQLNQSKKLSFNGAMFHDISYQYRYLKQAGISFGQEETTRLSLSLQMLYARIKPKKLRFWGKIFGRERDYYVAQGIQNIKNKDDLPPNCQKAGQGINLYTYWVISNTSQQWIQLPLLTQEQLIASREIKFIFTGNLEYNIVHYPPFPGKQKHLLKAQIVRITHAAQIAPRGLYKLNEQNPKQIDFQQGFKIPQFAQANSLQSWIHVNPYILQQGRCSYYIDPKLSQQQVEALNAQNAQKDPQIQRLKGIIDDKPMPLFGFESNWVIKTCGQVQNFNRIGKEEGTIACYASLLIKNLSWPGACCLAYQGGWTNIYIGYGQKIAQKSFLPTMTPPIMEEPNQIEEFSQPNPSKAPEEVKPPEENKQQEQPAQ